MTGPRQTHRWRELVRKRLTIAEANDEHCALCGQGIDYTLPRQSRYGATVDHAQPIALDGDPYPALSELGPAHRICQGRQGAAISNARQGTGPGSRGGNPSTYTPGSSKPRYRPDRATSTTNTCEWCGCHFHPWNKSAGKYCSRECRTDASITREIWRYTWQGQCAICWKQITEETIEQSFTETPRPPRRHTCSKQCSDMRQRIQSGINMRNKYRTEAGLPQDRESSLPATTPEIQWTNTIVHEPAAPSRTCRHNGGPHKPGPDHDTEPDDYAEPMNIIHDSNFLSPKAHTPRKGKKTIPSMSTGIANIQPDEYGVESRYSPPRVMSERHEKAVGSFADEWIPWIENADDGPHITLREWQRIVLNRALEYDADGKLCWRDIVVSTPRQSGKGYLLWALAAARCHFAEQFGEPQELVHVANNLSAARRIHMRAWRWAADRDIEIRKAFGSERLIWDDGSHWSLCAVPAIWGWSASCALLDECWDIPPEVATEALLPTLVERAMPQMWLFSTANSGATRLMTDFRGRALAGTPRVMIAEWSARPGADVDDPAVWRAASPYWSEQREELIAATPRNSRAANWLNTWPGEQGSGSGFLPGWDGCRRVQQPPPAGCVGAVEVSADRSCYGAAAAWTDADGRVLLVSRVTDTLPQALAVLEGWAPSVVLAGASLAAQAAGPWQTQPAGLKESRVATPWLADAVRRGLVVHDHDPATAGQFALARTAVVESGELVSAKRSKGPIPAVKAAMWAAVAAGEDWYSVDAAVIW